jgi:hypothetical protein
VAAACHGGALLQIGLQCDRVALDVEPTNVDAIVELAAFFVAHTRRQLYAHLRSTTLNTPMARWRYLRDCVLLRLRERDGTLCRSWPALLVFCKQRRQYMQLWRQYLASPDDPTVLQCVQLAESALRPTDVRLFRDLVTRSQQQQQQKAARRSRASSSAGAAPAPLPATPSAAAKPSGAKKFAQAFTARLKRNKKAPATETVSADEVEQLLMDVSNDNGTDDDEPGKSSTAAESSAVETNIVTSKIVVGFDLRSVSLRVFDRSGGTTPLLEVLTSDASLSFDLAPRTVGVSGKIQSFYVLHHRPADVRFAKLIDVSARAANVASTAVVVLDCRAESRETDLLTLLSTLEPAALRSTVVHVGLTVLPIDITLHCGVVRQLCDAFLAETVQRCAQELLSVRIWNRPEPMVVAATPSRVRAAALLGFPRLVLNCTYHAPTLILPTTAALAGQPDDGDAGAVPPLLVLCFGRLSATSPADAAHSTANEQTINLQLDTMRVVFSNNARADEADEASGVVTLVDRSDVRAVVRIVGGADSGIQCDIDASRLRAQLSHSMAARGAQIVTDSLSALVDKRSASWHFFSSVSRYAGGRRRRQAAPTPADARAMRSASFRVRVPSLEFDVLDDSVGETVISSSVDSLALDVSLDSRDELAVRATFRALTLRDVSEQRRHAQRAATAPNAASAQELSRLLHIVSNSLDDAAVLLTFRRAAEAGAGGALRVELEQSRVSCCLNRETVLFLYLFVERLLARFGASATTVFADLQSLSSSAAPSALAAAPPALRFDVIVGAVQVRLHNRGVPLCRVQLRRSVVRGEEASSGALGVSVSVARIVLEDKCTSGPHSAAVSAPRSAVVGVDEALVLRVDKAPDGATVLDVAVRGAGVAVLANFAAQVALWCTEFLEMRELLRRVGKRLTRALLARPDVAPLRYTIALSDTVLLVPRDSRSAHDALRLTVSSCSVSNRLFDAQADGAAHQYEGIDIRLGDIRVDATAESAPDGYLTVVAQRAFHVELVHPSTSPLPLRCTIGLPSEDAIDATVSVRFLDQLLDTMDGNLSETPPGLLVFVPPELTVPLPGAVAMARHLDSAAHRASPTLGATMAELNQHRSQLMLEIAVALPRISLAVVDEQRAAAARDVLRVAVNDAAIDVVKHSNDSLGVNFKATQLRLLDVGVAADGRTPPAPFDCLVDLPASPTAVTLHFFRGNAGAHELHLRLNDVAVRVTPRTVAALQLRFGALGARAADTIPRVKAFHFGPEPHIHDVFIVRLSNPMLGVSPCVCADAAMCTCTCFVLGTKAVAVQTKVNNNSGATPDDSDAEADADADAGFASVAGDDNNVAVAGQRQQLTVLASAEDVDIVRCTQRLLMHSRSAADVDDAVAIVQPFDLLLDLAIQQPQSLFRGLSELGGNGSAPWPHLTRTTVGHVSLQRSRRRADESAETLVFALSRVDLWALERLAKEFERHLARRAVAAAPPSAAAPLEMVSSAAVRLQLRESVDVDVSSRDSISIKLVAEFEKTLASTSVRAPSDVERAAAIAAAAAAAAARESHEHAWDKAQARFEERVESNYMAIGKVSLSSFFLHIAQRSVTPARLLGAMRAMRVEAERAGAARESLDTLACATLSCRHYNRTVCRWDCALEPWSFQLKSQLVNGALRSLALHSDSVLQLNVTSALVSFLHVALREVKQHARAADSSSTMATTVDQQAAAPSPRALITPTTPRRRTTTLSSAAAPPAPLVSSASKALATRSPAYTILNDTGEDVWFWLGSDAPTRLATRAESVLLYEETRATLSLQFVGSRTLAGLTVNQIGVYVLNPFPERIDDDDPDLAEFETAGSGGVAVDEHVVVVYEIAASNGTKRITLRSNVTIENDCDVPLEVCIEPSRRAQNCKSSLTTLPPQGRWMVPCRVATSGALSVRPALNDGGRAISMCQRRIALARLAAREEVIRCDRIGDVSQPFFLVASVQSNTELDPMRRPRVALDPRSPHSRDGAASELLLAFDVGYLGDYVLTFRPPLRLRNRLPSDVRVRLRSDASGVSLQHRRIVLEDVIAVAEQRTVCSMASLSTATLELRVGDYVWSSAASLDGARAAPTASPSGGGGAPATAADASPQSYVVSSTVEQLVCAHRSDKGHTLTLFADVEVHGSARVVSLYARWWLVNRLGQQLRFRTDSKRVLPADVSLDFARAVGGQIDEADLKAASRVTLYSNRRVAVSLGAAHDHWSSVVDLDAVASVGALEIERPGFVDGGSGRLESLCELGLQLQPAPGIFWRSKLLTFVPRFVLVNQLGEPLVYIQDFVTGDGGTDVPLNASADDASLAAATQSSINPHHPCVLDVDEQRAIHWEDERAPRRLRFATLKMIDRGSWSGAVVLNGTVDVVLRIRRADADARRLRLLDVRYHVDGATTFVVVCAHDCHADGSVKLPPYNIANRTGLPIVVQQAECASWLRDDVPPRQVIPWAWDEPVAVENRRLLAKLPGSDLQYELPLDTVAHHAAIDVQIAGAADGGKMVVHAQTRLIDGVRTLVFDHVDSRDEWELMRGAAAAASATSGDARLDVALRLPEVHIALIDQTPAELINVVLLDIDAHATIDDEFESIAVSVERLQIDNLLRDTPCEVLVWPGKRGARGRDVTGAAEDEASGPVSASSLGPSERPMAFIQLAVDRVRARNSSSAHDELRITDDGDDAAELLQEAGTKRSGDVAHYRAVLFAMQEFNVSIESAFLLRLADFVTSELLPALERAPRGGLVSQVPRAAVRHITRNVSLDQATLAKLSARRLESAAYVESVQIFPIRARFSYQTVPGTTRHLKERLSVVFGTLSQFGLVNVYQSPITLRGLEIQHALSSVSEFADHVGRHYLEQMIGQAAYVLGSSAALGNPVKFVGDLSAGIRDFLVEPAHGATLGPLQFASGVSKGTASLLRNFAQGMSASAFAVGDSLGTGVAALSLDRQYVHARRARALDRPSNIATGFMYGLRDLSGGLYGGVTGILSQPFRGAKRDGLVGLVRGIGVGVLGVVVKPAVGVVDLATRTTEGLRNMSDDNTARRVRVPRAFEADGAVLPLSALVGATRAQAVAGATAPATADEQLAALAPHVLQQFQLPATERLHSYHQCALVDSVFFHSGYLYLFERHLCFLGLLRVNRECIPLSTVTGVYKRTLFGLETRVEVLHTPERGGEPQSTWLVSLTDRDTLYNAVMERWSAVAAASCFVDGAVESKEK